MTASLFEQFILLLFERSDSFGFCIAVLKCLLLVLWSERIRIERIGCKGCGCQSRG